MNDKINNMIQSNTQLVNELYKDIIQPVAKKTGKMGEDLLKFVALPFTFLGLTAEQLEEKYRTFLIKAVNKVPEEKREAPKPAIVSPLLDYLKYIFDDKDSEKLIDMFSDLLSKSINRDEKDNVHVSYVHTLLQLGHLEAEILFKMYEQDERDLGVVFKRSTNIKENYIKVLADEPEPLYGEDETVFFYYDVIILEDGINISDSVFFETLNILKHHNLVSTFKINKYKNEENYSMEKHGRNNVDMFDVNNFMIGYQLTQYGKDFMNVCISPEKNPHATFICSKCHYLFSNWQKDKTCPNCGSKDVNLA